MKQIIVTVGREHGSGGKYIAEQIAKQLGIAFYDKELLLDSVFNAEDAARYDEIHDTSCCFWISWVF